MSGEISAFPDGVPAKDKGLSAIDKRLEDLIPYAPVHYSRQVDLTDDSPNGFGRVRIRSEENITRGNRERSLHLFLPFTGPDGQRNAKWFTVAKKDNEQDAVITVNDTSQQEGTPAPIDVIRDYAPHDLEAANDLLTKHAGKFFDNENGDEQKLTREEFEDLWGDVDLDLHRLDVPTIYDYTLEVPHEGQDAVVVVCETLPRRNNTRYPDNVNPSKGITVTIPEDFTFRVRSEQAAKDSGDPQRRFVDFKGEKPTVRDEDEVQPADLDRVTQALDRIIEDQQALLMR